MVIWGRVIWKGSHPILSNLMNVSNGFGILKIMTWMRNLCLWMTRRFLISRIPWKQRYVDLPNNKLMAQCWLNSLMRRLERTGITDIHDQTIQKFFDSGYAERVPGNQLNLSVGSVWYIPHHPVLKKPGKVRPVFACSAQYKGVSLNSECLQGPNLTNNLIHFLLRFRQYVNAIIADIESMYLQVHIPEPDCNALHF